MLSDENGYAWSLTDKELSYESDERPGLFSRVSIIKECASYRNDYYA